MPSKPEDIIRRNKEFIEALDRIFAVDGVNADDISFIRKDSIYQQILRKSASPESPSKTIGEKLEAKKASGKYRVCEHCDARVVDKAIYEHWKTQRCLLARESGAEVETSVQIGGTKADVNAETEVEKNATSGGKEEAEVETSEAEAEAESSESEAESSESTVSESTVESSGSAVSESTVESSGSAESTVSESTVESEAESESESESEAESEADADVEAGAEADIEAGAEADESTPYDKYAEPWDDDNYDYSALIDNSFSHLKINK